MSASPIDFFIRLNQALWRRLPASLRDSRLASWYGTRQHALVCRRAMRRQYFGTFFLRNRPALELIRRIAGAKPHGATLDVAVLGCSSGAEVYSIAWTIRSARPDLRLRIHAADISAEIVALAERGIYTSESSELAGRSIFERMTRAELDQLFDWDHGKASVKASIRDGIRWHVADAADPALISLLGPQDVVVASNFLCHMTSDDAERCLRNLARLSRPAGYLLIAGVDLGVRSTVARDLGWEPVPDLLREIHDGDPSIREDWPWAWWGLEPLNDRRRDWQMRYAAAFRTGSG